MSRETRDFFVLSGLPPKNVKLKIPIIDIYSFSKNHGNPDQTKKEGVFST